MREKTKPKTRFLACGDPGPGLLVLDRRVESWGTVTVSLTIPHPVAPESPREPTQARHTEHHMSPRQFDISGIRTAIAVPGARTAVVALTLCAGLATSAVAQAQPPAQIPLLPTTSATITPSLSPDRLDAKATLTFAIQYAGGAFGVPAPVRRSVLQFPAGMSLDIPDLLSCSASRLRARGASGCPVQSEIGTGHALMEVRAGTEIITEDVALWAFLGPPANLQPTFEILGQGYTPLDERMVFTGSALPDHPPYGEELVLSIPAIPTLAFEPDASIASFSLTIGAGRQHRTRGANTVLVPSSCPVGGFPFAAEFTYADGSSGSALATAMCPR